MLPAYSLTEPEPPVLVLAYAADLPAELRLLLDILRPLEKKAPSRWSRRRCARTPPRRSLPNTRPRPGVCRRWMSAGRAENGELQLWNLPTRSVVTIDAHAGRWIKGFDIRVAPSGEKHIPISETTTFRLIAHNPQGVYILSHTVTPGP